MSSRTWKLRCLQCNHQGSDLVGMQEHLMERHGISRESFRTQERDVVEHYRWYLPNGTPLMEAVAADVDARTRTIVATFHPQAWVRDNAMEVDCEGSQHWDATDDVLALPLADIQDLKDNDYPTDHLHRSERAPQWIQDWGGPFYVEIQESAQEYFDLDDLHELTEEGLQEMRKARARALTA